MRRGLDAVQRKSERRNGSASDPPAPGWRKRTYRKWQAELFHTPWFARTFVLTMGRLATPIYRWAFELMRGDLERAHRIADIGCGNGLMAYHCSRELGGKSFTLVDRSAAQLAAGAGLHEKMRAGNAVTTHVAPAESIPLSEHLCDVVLSTGSVNLWDDPVQGIRECRRITRPGGVLWIFDQGPCDSIGLVIDALFRKRVFGVGIPGYTAEAVVQFADAAGLTEPRTHENGSLYGLRWALPDRI